MDCTLRSLITASPVVRQVSNPSCVGAATGTRILSSAEFRRILQTYPTFFVGMNLGSGPHTG